jgi:hypothetical protein
MSTTTTYENHKSKSVILTLLFFPYLSHMVAMVVMSKVILGNSRAPG